MSECNLLSFYRYIFSWSSQWQLVWVECQVKKVSLTFCVLIQEIRFQIFVHVLIWNWLNMQYSVFSSTCRWHFLSRWECSRVNWRNTLMNILLGPCSVGAFSDQSVCSSSLVWSIYLSSFPNLVNNSPTVCHRVNGMQHFEQSF